MSRCTEHCMIFHPLCHPACHPPPLPPPPRSLPCNIFFLFFTAQSIQVFAYAAGKMPVYSHMDPGRPKQTCHAGFCPKGAQPHTFMHVLRLLSCAGKYFSDFQMSGILCFTFVFCLCSLFLCFTFRPNRRSETTTPASLE